MTDLRKAAQQALEALENLDGIDTESECVTIDVADEITTLRAALAQPEPPAVRAAWMAGYTEGEKEALAQPDVPEGWRLVPVEPTPEMLTKADRIIDCDPRFIRRAWKEMLAAAPQPAQKPTKWAVFCEGCRKEWSVDYPHPGKSVCGDCLQIRGAPQPAPQKAKWVGLTRDDRECVFFEADSAMKTDINLAWRNAILDAAEAKLREKNGGAA